MAKSVRMPSAASRRPDSACIMPAGMLFNALDRRHQSSLGENTDDADIVTGAAVFVDLPAPVGNEPWAMPIDRWLHPYWRHIPGDRAPQEPTHEILCATALIALMVRPVYAQDQKPIEICREDKERRRARSRRKGRRKAYKNSLATFPARAYRPIGCVRSPGAPKPVAKSAAKSPAPKSQTKSGGTVN